MANQMNPAFLARQVNVQQHRQSSDSQSKTDFESRPIILQGEFLVEGEGEVLRAVSFPIFFAQKPHLTFGGSLEENQQLIAGSFPTVSVVSANWVVEKRGTQTYLYKGCDLAVVVTGARGAQKMWVNWTFTGTGLTNPTGGLGTVGGSV